VDATVNHVAIHYTYDVNASLPVVLAENRDNERQKYIASKTLNSRAARLLAWERLKK
jgi:hypothetical protein